MKKNTKNIKSNKMFIFNILFVISLVVNTIMLSNLNNGEYIENYLPTTISSLFVSLIFGIYVAKKKFISNKLNNNNKIIYIFISIVFTILYMLKLFNYLSIDIYNLTSLKYIFNYQLCRLLLIILSSFSVVCIINYFVIVFAKFIANFIKKIDNSEKNFIIIASMISLIVITYVYCRTTVCWQGFDKVFSMDSMDISYYMYDVLWNSDIRHILFGVIASPIGVVDSLFVKVFAGIDIYYVMLALFNSAMLIMIAIMLKRILKNKMAMYLYSLSYPFMLYSLFIEKYQICVFLIVLFIYSKYEKDKEIENFSLISSIGCMITTASIGLFAGSEKNIKKRIIEWIRYGLIFISVCFVCGKGGVLITIPKQLNNLMGGIPIKNTLFQRFYGLSELFYSSIFAPKIYNSDGIILWANAAYYLNKLGLLIILVCIVSFVINRKENYSKFCGLWILTAFILFIFMNWYCFEAPLFNIYFSWAIISLIIMAIEKIKNKTIKQFIYYTLITLMVIINVNQMFVLISNII